MRYATLFLFAIFLSFQIGYQWGTKTSAPSKLVKLLNNPKQIKIHQDQAQKYEKVSKNANEPTFSNKINEEISRTNLPLENSLAQKQTNKTKKTPIAQPEKLKQSNYQKRKSVPNSQPVTDKSKKIYSYQHPKASPPQSQFESVQSNTPQISSSLHRENENTRANFNPGNATNLSVENDDIHLHNSRTEEEWLAYLMTEKSLQAGLELYQNYKKGALSVVQFTKIVNQLIELNDPALQSLGKYLFTIEISANLLPYIYQLKNHAHFKNHWPFFVQLYRSPAGLKSYLKIVSDGSLFATKETDFAQFVLGEISFLADKNPSWVKSLVSNSRIEYSALRGQWQRSRPLIGHDSDLTFNHIKARLSQLIVKNSSDLVAENAQKIIEIIDREILAFHSQE